MTWFWGFFSGLLGGLARGVGLSRPTQLGSIPELVDSEGHRCFIGAPNGNPRTTIPASTHVVCRPLYRHHQFLPNELVPESHRTYPPGVPGRNEAA